MVEMSGTALAKVITAGLRGGARRRTSGLGCRGVVDGTAVVERRASSFSKLLWSTL